MADAPKGAVRLVDRVVMNLLRDSRASALPAWLVEVNSLVTKAFSIHSTLSVENSRIDSNSSRSWHTSLELSIL